MKRMIVRLLRPFWRLLGPIRRPLVARFDDRLARLMAGTVNARVLPELVHPLAVALDRLERIEGSLGAAERSGRVVAEEVDLVLSGLSREVFRLQMQVDELRRAVERDGSGRTGAARPAPFSIVDGLGDADADADADPYVDEEISLGAAPAERARVG